MQNFHVSGEDHDEPFLVLASDGLWDVLSVGEVSFLVHRVRCCRKRGSFCSSTLYLLFDFELRI